MGHSLHHGAASALRAVFTQDLTPVTINHLSAANEKNKSNAVKLRPWPIWGCAILAHSAVHSMIVHQGDN
jgi:hypothetical protein